MAYSNIDKPSKYFNTLTWTGDGTSRSLTGVGFSPDFVWVKLRSGTEWHVLNDSIRGATKNLYSNSTSAEITESLISSLNSDGFTVQNDLKVNSSGSTYVGWCWDANGTGASNTSGSITSTVSANTTSGFSIVSYTGTGANATVGHGLGVTPKMIIIKGRDTAYDWIVWFSGFSTTQRIILNSSGAISTGQWNTLPTSSVFGLGTHLNINQSGSALIAYCFAEIKGYSKFGSYTGNGSTDGTFIYTGFKPAFIMIKRTDTGDEWQMTDAKRNVTNGANNASLKANASASETVNSTWTLVDLLSNGFKQRYTDSLMNASGGTYIYMCFAENPFVSSKSIPTTAR